jgi:osmotically-inducible protein OsmY
MLRRDEMTRTAKARIFAVGAAVGAAFVYFFDPVTGRRRRKLTADQATAKVRRGWRRGERAGRTVAAEAYGVGQKLEHRDEEPKEFDDVTLARKVETEIFRDRDVPKGQINVNAQEGVVQLRGQVPTPDMINALIERTRKVQGVREVENLLHLPGTRAPTHEQ